MTDLQKFQKLWQETMDGAEYSLRASGAGERKEINRRLHREIWELRWGNTEVFPEARQFIERLLKEDQVKGSRIEEMLKNFEIHNTISPFLGIIPGAFGIAAIVLGSGFVRIGGFILTAAGAAAAVWLYRKNGNSIENVLRQMEELGRKCETVLRH